MDWDLGGGLAKFDGTNWTVFNTSNSGLPDNYVSSIAIDGSGNKWIGTDGGLAVYKEGGVVSVEEKIDASNTIPTNYVLHQNYPNPFNPSTTIKYQLPSNLANRQAGVKSETMPTGRQAANVKLMVFDILGREVVTLVNEKQNPGYYEVEWNAKAIPSGVYFYQLKTGSYVETKKMLMMK